MDDGHHKSWLDLTIKVHGSYLIVHNILYIIP